MHHYVLFATICTVSSYNYENTIIIDSNFNATSIVEDLQNSTEFQFREKDFFFNQTLMIKNRVHIKFGDVNITCLNGAFIFENVQHLVLNGIYMKDCGQWNNGGHFVASIFMLHCSNTSFSKVHIMDSTGIDVYMLDVKGSSEIMDSHFKKENCSTFSVYIEFRESNSGSTKILVDNSVFEGTKGPPNFSGGGLKIIFNELAKDKNITFLNCTFRNLSTSLEGGLYILFEGGAKNNTIIVQDTNFTANTCFGCGGGGLRVDFSHSSGDTSEPLGNSIYVCHSFFVKNNAKYGGAILVNVSQVISTRASLSNTIKFESCSWIANKARYGSALDAIMSEEATLLTSSKMFLHPVFVDCIFIKNKMIVSRNITVFGQGTISANHFVLEFYGNTSFTNNTGVPLYLISSIAHFKTNSSSEFISNSGLNGGAITLLDDSAIIAHDRTSFVFKSNKAYYKGGAIYYKSVNGHDYLTSKHCFLQYISNKGSTQTNMKPQYSFVNNTAGTSFDKNDSLGNSIYASSLVPCTKHCNCSIEGFVAEINISLACVGKFDIKKDPFEVATSEWLIKIEEGMPGPLQIIPGKVTKLPVETKDELGQTLNTVYKVTLWHKNSTDTKSRVLPAYRYIHKNELLLSGEPNNDTSKIALTTVTNREMRLVISIKLVHCPPGYILNGMLCRCSADLDAKFHYIGVIGCNSTVFQAKLKHGFWVGYSNSSSHKSLTSSICPLGFCQYNNSGRQILKNYPLPTVFNTSQLDREICGDCRTGKLCARCRDDKSVFYNSNSYQCRQNRFCSIGWLFYTLMEVIPVTAIFITVALFNVQLNSGSVTGLVLYYQLLDTMLINANDIITFPYGAFVLSEMHKLLSHMFNLNFLRIERLSFCLWKGASTLDIIAFQYFIILYALFMVILTIIGMKMCTCMSFCQRIRRVTGTRRDLANSIIHGVSGFFVLCFSEGTRVSLLLLKPTKYEDPYNTLNGTWYVFYDGELEYLKSKHLQYAIPALFFIFTISFVSPLLLLSYPLCYKVLALLQIHESKFSKWLCVVIPLEKLKPFFDSFQGSFKDNHRYVSGLYFVCRLIAVSLAVFVTQIELFYILFAIQLLVMIFVIAYCQPHKRRRHNRQDIFIFSILAIVNVLSFYNFKKAVDVVDYQRTVNVVTTVQMIIIYIPTAYIAIRIILLVLCRMKRCRAKNEMDNEDFSNELLERDCSDEGWEISSSTQYKRMTKC